MPDPAPNSLRFCFVTTFYPPHSFGGDGLFVQRLANALARRGHEVHVIHDVDAYRALAKGQLGPSDGDDPAVIRHVLSSRRLGPLDLLLSHQLGRPVLKRGRQRVLLDHGRFDVLHYHNISLAGGPAILEYGDGVKLCTLHDYWFVCPMHTLWRFDREACTRRTCLRCTLAGRRPPQLWRRATGFGESLRAVDAFIAGSRFACRMHAAQGFPVPVRCLPHFVPGAEDAREAEGPRESKVTTGAPGEPYFLYVGRLEKLKGVQVLVRRFRDYRSAELLIAGSGSYETELRQIAAGLPHVRFLKTVQRRWLNSLYRDAIAVIVPSLCYESFGLVPLEALMQGTPVIVPAGGALAEIVEDSGGGILYRTEDELLKAMEILRTDPVHRRRLGMQGRKHAVDNYSEETHLARYFALIAEFRKRNS